MEFCLAHCIVCLQTVAEDFHELFCTILFHELVLFCTCILVAFYSLTSCIHANHINNMSPTIIPFTDRQCLMYRYIFSSSSETTLWNT